VPLLLGNCFGNLPSASCNRPLFLQVQGFCLTSRKSKNFFPLSPYCFDQSMRHLKAVDRSPFAVFTSQEPPFHQHCPPSFFTRQSSSRLGGCRRGTGLSRGLFFGPSSGVLSPFCSPSCRAVPPKGRSYSFLIIAPKLSLFPPLVL